MSFYSLPLKRYSVEVPKEFCYLTICKYTDDSFKPNNGKKMTSEELKLKKEKLIKQEKTIRQLNTGYCNLYNNKIELSTIFNSFFTSYVFGDTKNRIFYKIQPLTSSKNNGSYYSKDKYETTEFNILKTLNTKEEVIDEIYKDGLLREFSATLFDNYSYANEGYDKIIFDYFTYIKNTYGDYEISLCDIVLTNDYNHTVRSKFNRKDTNKIAKTNIKNLLESNLIEYFKKDDYYQSSLIMGLVECGLTDIALECVKRIDKYELKYLKKSKNFNIILRKWSNIPEVQEIIKLADIILDGIRLIVKNEYDHNVIQIDFNNIGEAKTFIIKNYDVSFETIVNKDIEDLEVYDDDDTLYKFQII